MFIMSFLRTKFHVPNTIGTSAIVARTTFLAKSLGPQFELQDFIRRCKNLDRKKRAVQEWPNWRTNVMRRSGIEPSTLWRTAAMLLFYVLQKSCNKNYNPLPSTLLYTVSNLKSRTASIASTLKFACPLCCLDWAQFGLFCDATLLWPVAHFTFVLCTLPCLQIVSQSDAMPGPHCQLHTFNPPHKNPRITQLSLCSISILILRTLLLGCRAGVFEVPVLQVLDGTSLVPDCRHKRERKQFQTSALWNLFYSKILLSALPPTAGRQ
jgi:hypothetical protein